MDGAQPRPPLRDAPREDPLSAFPAPRRDGIWRPLGFLLLMLGFGLRLDTPWQGLAWGMLAAGAAVSALGLAGLADREPETASVSRRNGE